MKTKIWTIVGLCLCGCDDSFMDLASGETAEDAASLSLKRRKQPGKVIAAFEGELNDQLECDMVSK